MFTSDAVFRAFGPSHLGVLAFGAVAIALLVGIGRRGGTGERWTTGLLAFINLITYPLNQFGWTLSGVAMARENYLPFHLCDVASVIVAFALLLRNRRLADIAFYWGLAGTFQGIVTPALHYDFPHPAFIGFFLHHGIIVAAALYLPLVQGWRPERPWWRSPLRALLWGNLYVAVVMPLNWLLGTNFGFLARKPLTPSLLDFLGPWPVYILGMEALAAVFFVLLTLPFCRRRRE